MSTATAIARTLLPGPVRMWVKDVLNARRVRRNPARIVLVNEILPAFSALGGRILWVGCRRYTREYGAVLSRNGGECWTTDIERSHARWGEAGRHFTWDLVELDRLIAAGTFDSVLCNGVFGYGVDTRPAQLAALRAMWTVLRPGGRLFLGWTRDRGDDPLEFEFAQNAFVGDAFVVGEARLVVPGTPYVFDFLCRREQG